MSAVKQLIHNICMTFTTRIPQAKKFRKWVTNEVLPSIRKIGQYSVPKQPLKNKVEQIDFEKFIVDCFIPDSTRKS